MDALSAEARIEAHGGRSAVPPASRHRRDGGAEASSGTAARRAETATGTAPTAASGWRSRVVCPLVDGRNLCDPLTAILMLQVHDLFVRPVKVVRDERYLLDQLNEGVANDSPGRNAPGSVAAPVDFPQWGQTSSAASSRFTRL